MNRAENVKATLSKSSDTWPKLYICVLILKGDYGKEYLRMRETKEVMVKLRLEFDSMV